MDSRVHGLFKKEKDQGCPEMESEVGLMKGLVKKLGALANLREQQMQKE